MNDLTYDYKALVRAYADAHRQSYIHDDFKNFYSLRLKALETAFGIQFSAQGGPLKILFEATVRSYWVIKTPLSGFLDATLIYTTLRSHGEAGQQILELLRQTEEYALQNQAVHLEMLYQLFVRIEGEVLKTVTSEDLRTLGFDDSQEPKIIDYYDYL